MGNHALFMGYLGRISGKVEIIIPFSKKWRNLFIYGKSELT